MDYKGEVCTKPHLAASLPQNNALQTRKANEKLFSLFCRHKKPLAEIARDDEGALALCAARAGNAFSHAAPLEEKIRLKSQQSLLFYILTQGFGSGWREAKMLPKNIYDNVKKNWLKLGTVSGIFWVLWSLIQQNASDGPIQLFGTTSNIFSLRVLLTAITTTFLGEFYCQTALPFDKNGNKRTFLQAFWRAALIAATIGAGYSAIITNNLVKYANYVSNDLGWFGRWAAMFAIIQVGSMSLYTAAHRFVADWHEGRFKSSTKEERKEKIAEYWIRVVRSWSITAIPLVFCYATGSYAIVMVGSFINFLLRAITTEQRPHAEQRWEHAQLKKAASAQA